MAGETSAYGSVLGLFGDILGGISNYYANEDTEQYESDVNAWNRALQKIANENRRRMERYKERTELVNKFGSGWTTKPPTQEVVRGGVLEPSYATSEALDTGVKILKLAQDLTSSMSGSGDSGFGDELAQSKSTTQADTAKPMQTQDLAMNYEPAPSASRTKNRDIYGGYLEHGGRYL
jgi:hypothetical protein